MQTTHKSKRTFWVLARSRAGALEFFREFDLWTAEVSKAFDFPTEAAALEALGTFPPATEFVARVTAQFQITKEGTSNVPE